jgi:hypothetical protein
MSTMNRRAILAGAAAFAPLPAFALAANPNADLLALGAFMKLDLPEFYEALRVSHRLHKRTIRAVGHPTDNPDQDFWAYSRRFDAASIKCGPPPARSMNFTSRCVISPSKHSPCRPIRFREPP